MFELPDGARGAKISSGDSEGGKRICHTLLKSVEQIHHAFFS
jgi:hypothetical protein